MTEKSNSALPSGSGLGSLLHRVGIQVRRHGPLWLVRRAMREFRAPVTAPGRVVNSGLRWAVRHGPSPAQPNLAKDTLLAFYDLRVEPNTFDVLWFLIAAERERRRRRMTWLHVVFVGSETGAARSEAPDYREVISESSGRDRITNILVPLAWAVPSVSGVEILHDRREARSRLGSWPSADIFPPHYAVGWYPSCIADCVREMHRLGPDDIAGTFRASEAALTYIDHWLAARGGGKAVSITIRHYDFMPARNSNLAAWAQFARYLIKRGYFPVFIPDTESLARGIPPELAEFPHLNEAAWNLNLRIALYERAFLNLGINNGPAHLFIVDSRARGLMFKMITPGVPQAEAWFIKKQGFEIGGQLPFCTPFQKWVWEDDDFEAIKREFDEMEQRIREHQSGDAVGS
jgi:hypothetical protein